MDTVKMLNQIFQVCVIPLLGILTAYLVQFIQVKKNELIASTDSELQKKYLNLLADTITKCVQATNQTYVDALKEKNAFTPEAQKEAFNKTLNAVLSILNDEAKTYLNKALGDLNAYITNQIEAQVKAAKQAQAEEKK
jgi:hypothetical protein